MTERERPPGQQPEFVPPPPDVRLTPEEREELLLAVASVGATAGAAQAVLRPLDFPPGRLPTWTGMTPEDWWAEIFTEFNNGIVAQPYRRLINSLVRRYQAHPIFLRLHALSTAQSAETSATPPSRPVCHVIVRASDETERAEAEAVLRELRLEPQEVWSAEHAVSYAVNETEAARVRQALAQTSLGWTVVPAGQPDYLLRELFVQGPDGSRYQLVDAPAQQTFQNVASEVVAHYGQFAEASRPTVVDRVREDGQAERMHPEDTLHEAGVRDGDQLRVAFEANAGVNPIDHENALVRALNETVAFAARRPDVEIRADSQIMPSEIEVDFTRESFGPPATDGGEPIRVSRHTVRVEFGPEYPDVAPDAFWRTPFFHPNVFPNYDCEEFRRNRGSAGWVCLGVLKESWYPQRDMGDVWRMLVDMAGFRNYELYDMRDGAHRVNFVDKAAADWANEHQDDIIAIGGRPITPRSDVEPKGMRNVIYPAG